MLATPLLHQAGDVRNDAARHFGFVRRRQDMRAGRVEQGNRIAVATEAVLHQIADHQRELLRHALAFGILRQVLTLGGEADAKRRIRPRRDFGKDVGVGFEFQGEGAVPFLIFCADSCRGR
jgi:hypothetical protein